MNVAQLRRFVAKNQEQRRVGRAKSRTDYDCRIVYSIRAIHISTIDGAFVVWKAGKRGVIVLCRRHALSSAKSEAERYANG